MLRFFLSRSLSIIGSFPDAVWKGAIRSFQEPPPFLSSCLLIVYGGPLSNSSSHFLFCFHQNVTTTQSIISHMYSIINYPVKEFSKYSCVKIWIWFSNNKISFKRNELVGKRFKERKNGEICLILWHSVFKKRRYYSSSTSGYLERRVGDVFN